MMWSTGRIRRISTMMSKGFMIRQYSGASHVFRDHGGEIRCRIPPAVHRMSMACSNLTAGRCRRRRRLGQRLDQAPQHQFRQRPAALFGRSDHRQLRDAQSQHRLQAGRRPARVNTFRPSITSGSCGAVIAMRSEPIPQRMYRIRTAFARAVCRELCREPIRKRLPVIIPMSLNGLNIHTIGTRIPTLCMIIACLTFPTSWKSGIDIS